MRGEATFTRRGKSRRLAGDIISANAKTVWIRLDVNRRPVKRHRRKHGVKIYGEPEATA